MMINKKILSAACITALSTGFSASSMADSVTGTASATVLAPLALTESVANSMNFGNVAGDNSADTTVVLAAAGGTTSADAYTDGAGTAGSFAVTGEGALAYTIGLPADGVVTLTDGFGSPMAVSAFKDSSGGTNAAPTTTNLAAGADAFTVGATLTINAGQTAGTYTGTYDITANYQ